MIVLEIYDEICDVDNIWSSEKTDEYHFETGSPLSEIFFSDHFTNWRGIFGIHIK